MAMLQVSDGDARVASSGVGGSPHRADHRVNESRGDTNDYPHFVRAQPRCRVRDGLIPMSGGNIPSQEAECERATPS